MDVEKHQAVLLRTGFPGSESVTPTKEGVVITTKPLNGSGRFQLYADIVPYATFAEGRRMEVLKAELEPMTSEMVGVRKEVSQLVNTFSKTVTQKPANSPFIVKYPGCDHCLAVRRIEQVL